MMTMFWNLISVKFDWKKEKGEYFSVISSFEKEIDSTSSRNSDEDIPMDGPSRRTRSSTNVSKSTIELDDSSLNSEWDRPMPKKTRGARSRKRNV